MIRFIKKKEIITIVAASLIIVSIFFYKTILFQQIPFPGDLLISQNPYKTESFLGYAPGGYPNLAQGWDVIAQLFPWKYFSIQELKAGRIPFWNPYNFSGNLHMQNYQTGVFYIANILFFLFSFPVAWSFFIMLQPVLGMLFMYLFLRNMSMSKRTSFIGGIAFAFSSYMIVWMEYGNIGSTMIWLPLILFCLKNYINKPRIFYFLLSICALTFSFLAGYIQGIFYIYIVGISYAIFLYTQKKENRSKHSFIGISLLLLLPISLSAFQLLPTYDLFTLSTRSPYSLSQIENLLNPLYYWVTIFAPDFFGNPAHRNYFLPITYIERVMYLGVPLILFVFLSIFKVKNSSMKFFLILGIVFLLITTNLPFIKYLYLIPIPMISTTVPTRALSVFIFCMIIVSCFGMEYWLREKKAVTTKVPFLFIGIYGLLWIILLLFSKIFPDFAANRTIAIHNLFFSSLIAIVVVGIFYLKRISEKISFTLLLILVVIDLFLFFQKITPFSPQSLIYPKTSVMTYVKTHAGIYRFWGYGSAYIPANFQTYDGTYSPEGNDPLHRKEYGLLLASSENGKYPVLLPRPDANLAPGSGLTEIRNPNRQKILNLLGVKYIVSREDTFPEETYSLVWQKNPWKIYENKQVLPRYFLANQYVISKTNADALAQIYKQDISKTLILNSKPYKPVNNTARGTVKLLVYSPETVSFETNTTGAMLLFLSDEYYHSWQSQIDGHPVPIYKADLAFRAVEIPKGKHIVRYVYSSFYFPIGINIAIAGGIICIIYSIYFYLYVEKK